MTINRKSGSWPDLVYSKHFTDFSPLPERRPVRAQTLSVASMPISCTFERVQEPLFCNLIKCTPHIRVHSSKGVFCYPLGDCLTSDVLPFFP